MPKQQIPGQEALIVVAEQTGQMQPRDFSESGNPQAEAIEQNLHLINALGALAGARMRAGLVRIGPEGVLDRYGEAASAVVQGAERVRVELVNQATESFKRATGYYAMLDIGIDRAEVERVHRASFSDFLKEYYLTGREKANRDYRKQLQAEITQLSTNPEQDVSLFNREQGWRPHRLDAEEKNAAALLVEDKDQELPQLNAAERLEAILSDPRAGFLPKQSHELVRVLAWLDYLDDPTKELGIIHQLREVFVNAQHPGGKRLGVRYGIRALESITWELGDDLLEAIHRLHALRGLKVTIDQDQSPDISLFEECCTEDGASEHSLALAAYVHYQDLLEYMENGTVAGLEYSPLWATEDPSRSQRPKFSAEPGKRKIVLNQYTRLNISDEYKTHITRRLKSLTIGKARSDIAECEADLEKQISFLSKRLSDIEGFRHGPTGPLKDALATIRADLQRYDAVA